MLVETEWVKNIDYFRENGVKEACASRFPENQPFCKLICIWWAKIYIKTSCLCFLKQFNAQSRRRFYKWTTNNNKTV